MSVWLTYTGSLISHMFSLSINQGQTIPCLLKMGTRNLLRHQWPWNIEQNGSGIWSIPLGRVLVVKEALIPICCTLTSDVLCSSVSQAFRMLHWWAITTLLQGRPQALWIKWSHWKYIGVYTCRETVLSSTELCTRTVYIYIADSAYIWSTVNSFTLRSSAISTCSLLSTALLSQTLCWLLFFMPGGARLPFPSRPGSHIYCPLPAAILQCQEMMLSRQQFLHNLS